MTKVEISKHAEISAMYMAGKTQEEVAAVFGLHRTRVRKILLDLGALGRKADRTTVNLKLVQSVAKKERRVRKHWGMSLSEYETHVAEHGSSTILKSPMRRYIEQKKMAEKRGVGWGFDFSTWWATWQASGHWQERGVGSGYVMARQFDGGTPYSPTTVYFCTGGQNTKDGFTNNPSAKRGIHAGSGKGVFPNKSRRNPYRAMFRQKHLGCYPTEETARAAYLAAAEAYKRSIA